MIVIRMYNQNSINMNQYPPYPPRPIGPMTTQQMIRQSPLFRVTFYLSLLLCVVVLIFTVLIICVDCTVHQPCSFYYDYEPVECNYGDLTYCCSYSYSHCGDYSSCDFKPFEYDTCWGLMIAQWICCGFVIVLAIVNSLIGCNLRRRYQQQMYMVQNGQPQFYGQQPAPIYVQPNQHNQPPGAYLPPQQQQVVHQNQPIVAHNQPVVNYNRQMAPQQQNIQPNYQIQHPEPRNQDSFNRI